MATLALRAASTILVPAGTVTVTPSTVRVTSGICVSILHVRGITSAVACSSAARGSAWWDGHVGRVWHEPAIEQPPAGWHGRHFHSHWSPRGPVPARTRAGTAAAHFGSGRPHSRQAGRSSYPPSVHRYR